MWVSHDVHGPVELKDNIFTGQRSFASYFASSNLVGNLRIFFDKDLTAHLHSKNLILNTSKSEELIGDLRRCKQDIQLITINRDNVEMVVVLVQK